MDDIIRPRRPQTTPTTLMAPPATAPTTTPLASATNSSTINGISPTPTVTGPTVPSSTPISVSGGDLPSTDSPQPQPQPVVPTPQVASVSAQNTQPAPNLPATEPDGSSSNLGEVLQPTVGDDTNGSASSLPAAAPAAPSPSLLAEIEAEEARQNQAKVTQAPVSARRKGHWPAIIVAIVLAVALIAGAGYAYWRNNKTTSAPASTPQTTSETTKNPATAKDIDSASSDIDSAIKSIDETKALQESDLSDTTLGL